MAGLATNVVRRVPLIAAIETRLAELRDTTPPTKGYLSLPVDVPTIDTEGHVQRYWVLHPFGGTPLLDQDLADTGIDLEWTFQVTAAAASPGDALSIATDIDALLYRWAPAIEGYEIDVLRPPPGYDPGPIRIDRDVKPYRFWLPLQYRTTITR